MQTLEEKYKEIIKEIKLYQNGAVSQLIEKKGKTKYMLNFGVSISTIRKIASPYIGDNELALKLWNTNIRETKILSTLIIRDTYENHQHFLPQNFNSEIIHQIAYNFLSKKNNVENIVSEYLQDKSKISNALAFATISLLAMRKSVEDDKFYIDILKILSHNFNFFNLDTSYTLIYNMLINISLVSKTIHLKVLETTKEFENNNIDKLNLIKNNIEDFLSN